MKKFISLILFLFALSEIFGQRPTLTLTFSAVNNTDWVQLDSIKVMNRTQGGDTVLYYPDTVLVLDYQVGIPEPHRTIEGFQVFQNYPNPVGDQTMINLYVPSKDNVSIIVTDVLGRVIIRSERMLDEGLHSFRFVPGDGSLYFFTAQWRGEGRSIKILQSNLSNNGTCFLEYFRCESSSHQLKVAEDIQSFLFSMGDELLYICYIDTLQSGVLDFPEENKSYTFQFATNIPCPGTPVITYEGQIYNTIQIFSQCWLKENLNVGTMIPGTMEQSNNGTIEKHCYNDYIDNCTMYGGLYEWNEMMQYVSLQGAQGICPPGWHIPSDAEWKILEGNVDGQYGVDDPVWNIAGWRGYDAGINLKSTDGWNSNGNGTDLYGFTALPGGFRDYDGTFYNLGIIGDWWTSTESWGYTAWLRSLFYNHDQIERNLFDEITSRSLRCLKD